MALTSISAMTLAACGSAPKPAAQKARPKSSSRSAPTFVYSDNDDFSSTRSYNIYNSAFPHQANHLVVLSLGTATGQSIDSYVPQVAKSWSYTGSTVTVHIRAMKWQTGKPVTTTDVVDSELLAGLAGNPVWQDISNVRSLGSRKVQFTLAPGVAPVVALASIMDTYVVPAQQYGRFVTPGLDKLVSGYYRLDAAHPNAAPKSALGKQLDANFAKLSKFNPPTIIGDGPFIWKSWTTSEALLTKSPTFYAASKVHVPTFEYQELTSSGTAGSVLSGSATIDTAGLPWTVYQKELRLPHQHIYAPPSYAQFQLLFNDKSGPTSNPLVRQAIVYVIHRPSFMKLVYGPHPYYHYVRRPTVTWYTTESHYLTKTEYGSLNPYNYSPTKATSLLRRAGYRKVGGHWVQPNGKPFTLRIYAPSGFDNVISTYKVFAGWLTAFGIKTTEIVSPYAQFTADQVKGQFEMSFYYGGLYVDPLEFIATTLGPIANYPAVGAYKGDYGLGFGPVASVPGIGRVNVPATIAKEATSVAPGPRMNKLVYDWAKLVNQQMPFFSYIDKNYPLQFSTRQYGDWPPKSSPLWTAIAMDNHAGLAAMMEQGYIRPRS